MWVLRFGGSGVDVDQSRRDARAARSIGGQETRVDFDPDARQLQPVCSPASAGRWVCADEAAVVCLQGEAERAEPVTVERQLAA
jgi:hypothetical protein